MMFKYPMQKVMAERVSSRTTFPAASPSFKRGSGRPARHPHRAFLPQEHPGKIQNPWAGDHMTEHAAHHPSSISITPELGGSHTATVAPMSTAVECYGCYRVTGPARLVKAQNLMGSVLEAYLGTGAQLEMYHPGGNLVLTHSGTIPDDKLRDQFYCICVGQHVEIKGGFEISGLLPEDESHMHQHDGKLVLSVGALHHGITIQLQAGAQLSHPVVVGPREIMPYDTKQQGRVSM